jgi:sugar lactone lactonase YvrE
MSLITLQIESAGMGRRIISAIVAILLFASSVYAGDKTGRKIEPIRTGLDNPCAIAVHPSSGELYVAESGAGRIVRVQPGDPPKIAIAIEGFPREQFGDGPSYRIGPLGLAFIDRLTLVVGEGGQRGGADVVRVYQLPVDGETLRYDQSKYVLAPGRTENGSTPSDDDFFGVAATPTNIFVTSQGDEAAEWILRIDRSNATATELLRFVNTKAETATGAPGPLVISKRGDLVVGQMGKLDQAKDSRLTFYQASTGKMLLSLETGLLDITGLAFSPRGRLYAVDFAWADPAQGGLFRLDMDVRNSRQAIKPEKLEAFDRPTALVCPTEGTVYVTTLGNGMETPDSEKKTGQLLKITGEF